MGCSLKVLRVKSKKAIFIEASANDFFNNLEEKNKVGINDKRHGTCTTDSRWIHL